MRLYIVNVFLNNHTTVQTGNFNEKSLIVNQFFTVVLGVHPVTLMLRFQCPTTRSSMSRKVPGVNDIFLSNITRV